MRLCHFSPNYYSTGSIVGGGEKYPLYLIRSLERAAIAAFDHSIVSLGASDARVVVDGGRVVDVIGRDGENGFEADRLIERIDDADIVIVYQCFTPIGLFVASHAKLRGKKVVGLDMGGGEHPFVFQSPEACSMYDFFVAYSKFCADGMRAFGPPVLTILGPVDTDYYELDAAPRDERLLLMIGRILPHKGHEQLIRSLAEGDRCIIAGNVYDADYERFLRGLIKLSRAEVEIRTGASDRCVKALIQRASLFVHPSRSVDHRGARHSKPELLGLAPLEAMACGTPALVSCAGALEELGELAGCTTFADEGELQRLLRRVRMGELKFPAPSAIRAAVVERYGLEQFGEKLARALTRPIEDMRCAS